MSRIIRLVFVVAIAIPLAAQQIVDSPLVALAKRTGRLGKIPTHVITNDEVAAARGRVSWAGYPDEQSQTAAAAQASASVPLPAVSDWAVLQAEHAERLASQHMRENTYTPPTRVDGTTRASYTQMRSSASNATVSSSTINASPLSTARPMGVQSTVNSSLGSSTVSNSAPQPVPGRKID